MPHSSYLFSSLTNFLAGSDSAGVGGGEKRSVGGRNGLYVPIGTALPTRPRETMGSRGNKHETMKGVSLSTLIFRHFSTFVGQQGQGRDRREGDPKSLLREQQTVRTVSGGSDDDGRYAFLLFESSI